MEGKDAVREVSRSYGWFGLGANENSLDYLFQLSVEMSKMGLDPNAPIEEVETD